MIIVCPKCQTKLKIADDKIKPEGTKFKCPKCAVVLSVRRPAPRPAAPASSPTPVAPAPRPAAPASSPTPVAPAPRPAPIASSFEALKPSPKPIPKPALAPSRKALVAHENPNTAQRIEHVLNAAGFSVIQATDGVQVVISAIKEQAALAFVDPALSKINGFELAKRLKDRQELKGIKVILISSTNDTSRMRRTLSASPEVDAYVDEDEIGSSLDAIIRTVLSPKKTAIEQAAPNATLTPATTPTAAPVAPLTDAGEEEGVKKAKRLARTVLSDIALYNPEKVAQAIREGTFEQTFESDLKEGLKHYNNRVPEDIRARKDYFREAIDNFIETKKRATRSS